MKLKFILLQIGLTLITALADAETFNEITADEANFTNVTISENLEVSGITTLKNPLSITIPKGTKKAKFIACRDNNIAAYPTTFYVSQAGQIASTGLNIMGQSTENSLNIFYKNVDNDKNLVFSTNNESGTYSPIKFTAEQYTFDRGEMIINGKLICNHELIISSLNTSNIKANDINININNAADYVFDEDYQMKSLSEIEAFVKENKHLPGIPSAAEMSENGVSVSTMSNILLEKIEELTLHLIRLEKENAELKAEFESLEK